MTAIHEGFTFRAGKGGWVVCGLGERSISRQAGVAGSRTHLLQVTSSWQEYEEVKEHFHTRPGGE